MNINEFGNEFYPTPKDLLEKITKEVKWGMVGSVLEPSAGKGDIVEFINDKCKNTYYSSDNVDIDCVEIDKDLQSVLKGKGFKVVHDDFLTYNTFKRYELIIMNPPFSCGAKHLLKALDMQKDGGNIICILNAETFKNAYSNERKDLLRKLEELNASIEYMQNEFVYAERRTYVEIAVVKVCIENKKRDSFIYEDLKRKSYTDKYFQDSTDIAPSDYIEAIVKHYNMEIESGVKFINEYRALSPYITRSMESGNSYNDSPILRLTIGDSRTDNLSVNGFVKEVRRKYWSALFENKKFTGNMTSNLLSEYRERVNELVNYDFSKFNILSIQEDMSKHIVNGIEECIIKLFDDLSRQYAWDDFSSNIHYYNGWKTNKSWIINKKVIIPYMNAFDNYNGRFDPNWTVKERLQDIEKALNYLDGGLTDAKNLSEELNKAKENGQTKKIDLKYFYVTFYKKGTCHIEFKDMELLKKLNIFGSQQKGWLPPSYGSKAYSDMDVEEKYAVNEFEGEKEYTKTMHNVKYYIYNPKSSLPQLEMI